MATGARSSNHLSSFMHHPRTIARFAWIVLAWNVLVILWGAVVRATGAGAGCGSHWPLCDGEVVPREPAVETLIELTHRLTSGVALLLVVALVFLAFRAFPRGHACRRAAVASLVLILIEAAIGAGLVLFELVADNSSPLRAVYMAAHLVNTLFLLAALTLTARWAETPPAAPFLRRLRAGLIGLACAGLLLTGATGAVSALGDTLFPAGSLAEGLRQDLDPGTHFLVRLRVFHPLVAVAAALLLLTLARRELESARRTAGSTRLAQALMALVLLQVAAGVLNIALLAPVWMQIVHLFLADLVWIVFVLFVDGRASPAVSS